MPGLKIHEYVDIDNITGSEYILTDDGTKYRKTSINDIKNIADDISNAESASLEGKTAGAQDVKNIINNINTSLENHSNSIADVTASLSDYTKVNSYLTDTGVANAYVITPSPVITSYVAGQIFRFKAVNANTGASTVSANGLTAKSILKNVSVALATGDILAGQIITTIYDGANFQIIPDYSTQLSNLTSYAEYSITANISIPGDSTATLFSLNSTLVANSNTVLNSGGIKILKAGTYLFINTFYLTTTGGIRYIQLLKNGNYAKTYAKNTFANDNSIVNIIDLFDLNVNDVLTFKVIQSSGSSVNIPTDSTSFKIKKVG